MLRRRHAHFRIDLDERDQWLLCMKLALDEVVDDDALRHDLHDAIARVADHMRNQPEIPRLSDHRSA
jgi:hemoglobin